MRATARLVCIMVADRELTSKKFNLKPGRIHDLGHILGYPVDIMARLIVRLFSMESCALILGHSMVKPIFGSLSYQFI